MTQHQRELTRDVSKPTICSLADAKIRLRDAIRRPHCRDYRATVPTYERGEQEPAELEQKDRKFIDRKRIVITAGNGGSGAVSFRKDGGSKGRRGANGGNGGNGASVWIKALKQVKSLSDVPFRVTAEDGGKGAKEGTQGRRGPDVELCVPVGTVVWKEFRRTGDIDEHRTGFDDEGIDFSNWGSPNPVSNEYDEDESEEKFQVNLGNRPRGINKGKWEILVDLKEHGSHFRLAKGGIGGKGNKSKPKGKLAATCDLGTEGEKVTVVLELKVSVCVSLVSC